MADITHLLNQECTIATLFVTDKNGNLIPSEEGIKECVPCRFAYSSGHTKAPNGELIEYDCSLHLNNCIPVLTGYKVEVRGETPVEDENGSISFNQVYYIINVKKTIDRQGKCFKQFCRLSKYPYIG